VIPLRQRGPTLCGWRCVVRRSAGDSAELAQDANSVVDEAEKGDVMRRLIALVVGLLAAIGAATVFVLWRRNHQESWDSSWSSAKEKGSSWAKAAADEAGRAADKLSDTTAGVAGAARTHAEETRDSLGN
jgi:hypothetical protein